MTPEALRSLALALPEAEERSHFGKADFRVRNKIFASLRNEDTGVVKLTPDAKLMEINGFEGSPWTSPLSVA